MHPEGSRVGSGVQAGELGFAGLRGERYQRPSSVAHQHDAGHACQGIAGENEHGGSDIVGAEEEDAPRRVQPDRGRRADPRWNSRQTGCGPRRASLPPVVRVPGFLGWSGTVMRESWGAILRCGVARPAGPHPMASRRRPLRQHPAWRPHTPGNGRRPARPRRKDQPRDRRAALPVGEHRANPPAAHIPQTRHRTTWPAHQRPPPGLIGTRTQL